jgi:hypothetical protein
MEERRKNGKESEATAKTPRSKAALDIAVTSRDPIEQDKQVAAAMLRPSVRAGITITTWGTRPFDVGVTEVVGELQAQGAAASGGDLSRFENMLAIQAHTLDTLFNEYARLAKLNLADYLNASERFMRLALKSQSQCRATIETLAVMKNPPAVAFVKQANIANGHQQVNNGRAELARENSFPPNELLEQSNERLEHREAQTPVIGDSKLAALATIDRAEDSGRKEAIEHEQLQARCEVARIA